MLNASWGAKKIRRLWKHLPKSCVWRMFSTSLESLDYSSNHRFVATLTIPSEYLVETPAHLCSANTELTDPRQSEGSHRASRGPSDTQCDHRSSCLWGLCIEVPPLRPRSARTILHMFWSWGFWNYSSASTSLSICSQYYSSPKS